MSTAPKTVTIFGGSGFVGRYIARRMARDGWRVRVAVRRPNEAVFVRTYGTVGQVAPVLANIRNDESVRAALVGSDAVVNCVGILLESSRQKFKGIQAEGAGRIARIAAEEGVTNLVHLSSLSADANSDSDYARTKAEGEAAVTAAFPSAVILRPSIIFGPEDEFFNRFAKMARFTFFIPLVRAEALFQVVYVDDVAQAAVLGAKGHAEPGVYELGGPVVRSFRNYVRGMLDVIQRRRVVIDIPLPLARLNALFLDTGSKMTAGLFPNRILTRDQVKLLQTDNVVSEGARTLADLGIEPTPVEAVLESYLYCHRPSGQYAAIKNSAKNLRT